LSKFIPSLIGSILSTKCSQFIGSSLLVSNELQNRVPPWDDFFVGLWDMFEKIPMLFECCTLPSSFVLSFVKVAECSRDETPSPGIGVI